jgi:hypothetical protein
MDLTYFIRYYAAPQPPDPLHALSNLNTSQAPLAYPIQARWQPIVARPFSSVLQGDKAAAKLES